jgi:thioesterase domain-containing protein
MGDAGEGLVDAESRIQERIEELQNARELARRPRAVDPERVRKLESLKLAQKELSRQFEAVSHPARKSQIKAAIEDLQRQISAIEAG